MKKDLMLDLETLGNTSDSVIVQIGACVFDRNTGEITNKFSKYINIEDACKHGKISPSTVEWWLQQSKQAQESVFGKTQKKHNLKTVLQGFSKGLGKDKYNVWCHATFDFPILQNAYNSVGLEFPFSYFNARDLRTIVDLSGLNIYRDYRNKGIAHNALDDCVNQVKYTVDAIGKLRE